MTIYVRHMAWLNATPKPDEGTKRAEKGVKSEYSRIEIMRRQKIDPPMPPNPAPYLINHLIEIGLTEAAGMGAGPLSWQTIAAWRFNTGIRLSPWEARMIRKLSTQYLAESRRAESESCPPPWHAPVTQRERDTEVDRLRMVLG